MVRQPEIIIAAERQVRQTLDAHLHALRSIEHLAAAVEVIRPARIEYRVEVFHNQPRWPRKHTQAHGIITDPAGISLPGSGLSQGAFMQKSIHR